MYDRVNFFPSNGLLLSKKRLIRQPPRCFVSFICCTTKLGPQKLIVILILVVVLEFTIMQKNYCQVIPFEYSRYFSIKKKNGIKKINLKPTLT